MRLTRVYVEEALATGSNCVIGGSAANHVMRVLRLRDGDALTLFDGRGGEYGARIAGFRKDSVQVEVREHRKVERESGLNLTLAQGISRGERMDWVMQKATELGVARIVPLITERSVVKLDEKQRERKVEHWRAIVIAACEQSGRNRVPEIATPCAFREVLRPDDRAGRKLLLSPLGNLNARDLALAASEPATLLVGPEGGLSEEERDLAVDAGFEQVRMGPRVLRTETAAIAALTILQHDYGDL
ncbi:MAG: 16S rRNA (uracil(1498)-N(3))-methyltransferase [Gammaproteobacteria bacterium]